MAIQSDIWSFMDTCLSSVYSSYSGLSMLELGNQRVKYLKKSAKLFFSDMGFNHVSFDLNGRDSSLVVDLSEPVSEKYHNQFHVVTNFGTSEHVKRSQYRCFENMHYCVKMGGLIIHAVPLVGRYRLHGYYQYDEDFFYDLVKYTGSYLVDMKLLNRSKGMLSLLICCMKKRQKSFCSVDQFGKRGLFAKRKNMTYEAVIS